MEEVIMDAAVEEAVVEDTIKTVVEEEILSNDGEHQNDNMEVTEAFLEGVEEEVVEPAVIVTEEEIKENTDVFVETEGDDINVPQESDTNVSSSNETYTILEVLIPSSSDKPSRKRNTPSRPLCAADIEYHSTLSPTQEQQQDNEQNVFSAIEQEVVVEEQEVEEVNDEEVDQEEDEDKENIEQPQEEQAEVPMINNVKTTIKSSSSTSSGQPAVKRLSSLYLPTKSTLARVRDAETNESSSTTMRPSQMFSGSQSLKSAMSSTSRSMASVASSTASMNHHMRSASYKSPQTRGMCKVGSKHNNNNNNNNNKGFKKPSQPHAAIAVRRGPTIPVTPHFRSDARSKMHYKERPLTTEERELAAIEIARKMEELRMKKTKKVRCILPWDKTQYPVCLNDYNNIL